MIPQPHECPKFDGCSAPICPLDPEWPQACHLEGEAVCLWLRELSKPSGEAVLAHALPGNAVQVIVKAAPNIIARHGPIRRMLKRAAQTGSKVQAGQRAMGVL